MKDLPVCNISFSGDQSCSRPKTRSHLGRHNSYLFTVFLKSWRKHHLMIIQGQNHFDSLMAILNIHVSVGLEVPHGSCSCVVPTVLRNSLLLTQLPVSKPNSSK